MPVEVTAIRETTLAWPMAIHLVELSTQHLERFAMNIVDIEDWPLAPGDPRQPTHCWPARDTRGGPSHERFSHRYRRNAGEGTGRWPQAAGGISLRAGNDPQQNGGRRASRHERLEIRGGIHRVSWACRPRSSLGRTAQSWARMGWFRLQEGLRPEANQDHQRRRHAGTGKLPREENALSRFGNWPWLRACS